MEHSNDSEEWAHRVAGIESWNRKLHAEGMRCGWSAVATYDVENLPAFIPAYVAIVRERFPELPETDAVGAVLVYLAVYLTRDGGGIEAYVHKDVEPVMPITSAGWWVCTGLCVGMPEAAVRIGWCGAEDDPVAAEERIGRSWARWMDDGGTLRFERAGVGLFLLELETGVPHKRLPNEDELIVAGISYGLAVKSKLPDEIKARVFRIHTAAFAGTVDALAARRAPKLAKHLSEKYDTPVREDDVRSAINASFVEKGHLVPLALPQADGRVVTDTNTLSGARSVRDALEASGDLIRPGRGQPSPASLDVESADPDGGRPVAETLAASDSYSDPIRAAMTADGVRRVLSIIDELRRLHPRRAARYEAAIDRMKTDDSREAVAKRHSVSVKELRAAEDEIIERVGATG